MTRFGLLMVVAVGASGCGYSSGSMMPEGVHSVAVGIFGNETFYRHAEVTYTRELTRELVRRAHVDVRDPAKADVVITGRILTIPRITLVEDRIDQILEGGVVVRVEVKVEDPRTGQAVIDPFFINRRAEYVVPRPETLQTAIDEAVRDAARSTVHRIQAHSFLVERTSARQ
ncbi:MAG: hypothetical protein CMJ83_14970 [Planctomycetes bacterium]|nr:hypothetical protein [Planctomycetota bacterium]